ncbi:hypothetical protein JXJ21_19235 [candidate division KSB1 bacterium]|nr:hypothetical protein [candidate division KSB1 bacterium]
MLLAFFLMFSACFKRQQHEVLALEIPRYDLTGTIRDIDTLEPLPNIQIRFEKHILLHEIEFAGAADTTDSLGIYELPSFVPGYYRFIARRNLCDIFEKLILILYEDRIFETSIAKPLITKKEYYRTSIDVPIFEGFCWKYDNVLAGVAFGSGGFNLAEGNFTEGFRFVGDQFQVNNNPRFHGLAFLRRFWICDSLKIMSLSASDASVESVVTLGYECFDLTSDASHLWAIARKANTRQFKILKFGEHPSILKSCVFKLI